MESIEGELFLLLLISICLELRPVTFDCCVPITLRCPVHITRCNAILQELCLPKCSRKSLQLYGKLVKGRSAGIKSLRSAYLMVHCSRHTYSSFTSHRLVCRLTFAVNFFFFSKRRVCVCGRSRESTYIQSLLACSNIC